MKMSWSLEFLRFFPVNHYRAIVLYSTMLALRRHAITLATQYIIIFSVFKLRALPLTRNLAGYRVKKLDFSIQIFKSVKFYGRTKFFRSRKPIWNLNRCNIWLEIYLCDFPPAHKTRYSTSTVIEMSLDNFKAYIYSAHGLSCDGSICKDVKTRVFTHKPTTGQHGRFQHYDNGYYDYSYF
jgi:hypothetical protein